MEFIPVTAAARAVEIVVTVPEEAKKDALASAVTASITKLLTCASSVAIDDSCCALTTLKAVKLEFEQESRSRGRGERTAHRPF